MRPRHTAPEVVPGPADIEGGGNSYGKTISMAGSGGRPIIQPFEGIGGADGKSKGKRGMTADKDFLQKVGMGVAGIWLLGWLLLGWDVLWPLYLVLELFSYCLSFPPFSWFSWLFTGWFSRGAPVLNNGQPEAMLPQSQVSQYTDSYVQQYGDAALIFSTHDGYPQIVKELLANEELGYRDLLDARDDSGNTALIYAAAKDTRCGFKLCTAALLRAGADPELPNTGNGGRTPLMEAAGGGYKEIVAGLRMMPNVSVDLQDEHGNTALHYAAYHGHLPVVMELLKSNPNKETAGSMASTHSEIKNVYGHTAASYAMSNKYKGVADVLNRADPTRSQRRAKEKEKADEDAAQAIQDKIKEHLEALKAKDRLMVSQQVARARAQVHWPGFAPVYAAPTTAPTSATLAPAGPGRGAGPWAGPAPRLSVAPWAFQPAAQGVVRAASTAAQGAAPAAAASTAVVPITDNPEGEAAAALLDLKDQIGSLRKDLHQPTAGAVAVAPGAVRRSTGPPVMLAVGAPVAQVQTLGLSPRVPRASTASSGVGSAVSPRPGSACARGFAPLAFTEPVTRPVLTSPRLSAVPGFWPTTPRRPSGPSSPSAPASTAATMPCSAARALSPKETLLTPGARTMSPLGIHLHRPWEKEGEQVEDVSLRSSAEQLPQPHEEAQETTAPGRMALPAEVLRRMQKAAKARRGTQLKKRLSRKDLLLLEARARSSSPKSKAMEPLREGSPLAGKTAQWHKPGQLPAHFKDPPPGAWSPDFEPSISAVERGGGITDSERKALEEQLGKMRRQHEEAELKSQKRIVELLEKQAEQQKALDEAKDKHREYQLNHTELQMKVDELESRHRSSVLRAQDPRSEPLDRDREADRASSLSDRHTEMKLELERHKQRAEALERERDQHAEAAKRHQEHAMKAREEVTDSLTKLEAHHKEMSALREELQKANEEKRREEQRIQRMEDEIRRRSLT
eukprot:g827.t1